MRNVTVCALALALTFPATGASAMMCMFGAGGGNSVFVAPSVGTSTMSSMGATAMPNTTIMTMPDSSAVGTAAPSTGGQPTTIDSQIKADGERQIRQSVEIKQATQIDPIQQQSDAMVNRAHNADRANQSYNEFISK